MIAVLVLALSLASYLTDTETDTVSGCVNSLALSPHSALVEVVGFVTRHTRWKLYESTISHLDSNNNLSLQSPPSLSPVLFIHGHAGSHDQVRWLVQESLLLENSHPNLPKIAWFSAAMNEGFSALDSHILLTQAAFLNSAIQYIISKGYGKSVTIIAHSMGGIAAKCIFTLDAYQPGSVNTLITLATPHSHPPISIERDMVLLYTSLNKFWRSNSLITQNVALISIAGGSKDLQIQSQYATTVNEFIPQLQGFGVHTMSIPHVWTDLNHVSILWAHCLVKVVSLSLIQMFGVPEDDFQGRLNVWRHHILDLNEEGRSGSHAITNLTIEVLQIASIYHFLSTASESEKIRVMPLPDNPGSLSVTIISSVTSPTPNIWACSTATLRNCTILNNQFKHIPSNDLEISVQVLRFSNGQGYLAAEIIPATAPFNITIAASAIATHVERHGLFGANVLINDFIMDAEFAVPYIRESFYAYTMHIDSDCEFKELVVNVSVLDTVDSKFLRVSSQRRKARLDLLVTSDNGLYMQLYSTNTKCKDTRIVRIHIAVDWWTTLGSFTRKWSTNIILFTITSASMTFLTPYLLFMDSTKSKSLSHSTKILYASFMLYNIFGITNYRFWFSGSEFPSSGTNQWSVVFLVVSGMLGLVGHQVGLILKWAIEYSVRVLSRAFMRLPQRLVSFLQSPLVFKRVIVIILLTTIVIAPFPSTPFILVCTLIHSAAVLSVTPALPVSSRDLSAVPTSRNLVAPMTLIFLQGVFTIPHAVAVTKDITALDNLHPPRSGVTVWNNRNPRMLFVEDILSVWIDSVAVVWLYVSVGARLRVRRKRVRGCTGLWTGIPVVCVAMVWVVGNSVDAVYLGRYVIAGVFTAASLAEIIK